MVPPTCTEVRAIPESRSQRKCVTTLVREKLHLPTNRTESLHIKTFVQDTICETVDLALVTKGGKSVRLTVLVVPFIYNPLTTQPITHSRECYDHLVRLELADSADMEDVLEVDVLFMSSLPFMWTT